MSVVTLDSRVKVNENVIFQELQGEAVLLNMDSGVYFGLDPVGTRIWQLFSEHQQLAEIAKIVLAEYDVLENRCNMDLVKLVESLTEQGLVSVT